MRWLRAHHRLLPHIDSTGVDLLDLPRLTTQLVSLERRTARGGKDSVDHGPGGHDDLCNAAAGAWKCAACAAPPRISPRGSICHDFPAQMNLGGSNTSHAGVPVFCGAGLPR